MSSRPSLRAFLATARTALTAPRAQRASPLTLVVGNESADLDSLCSTILYAYLRTHTPPHKLHIPIANLPRDDLKLRPEMTAALAHAELKPSDLITLDDLPSGTEELKPEGTRWLLVDHNVLSGDLNRKFGERVVGCVDHHVEERGVPEDTGSEPRIVEPCGSCASLVVEYLRPAWEDLIAARPDPVDGHLARLALAPILIDTTDLRSAEKTTPKDMTAVAFLQEFAGAGAALDRDAFFGEISAFKEDISSLSFRDVFRKDYKQTGNEWDAAPVIVGISAVVKNLAYLVDRAGGDEGVLLAEFRKWCEEKRMNIGIIMTTSHPPGEGFQREILMWGFGKNIKGACESFLESFRGELQLETWGGGRLDHISDDEWRMAWSQKNLSHSRKQVTPMVRNVISDCRL